MYVSSFNASSQLVSLPRYRIWYSTHMPTNTVVFLHFNRVRQTLFFQELMSLDMDLRQPQKYRAHSVQEFTIGINESSVVIAILPTKSEDDGTTLPVYVQFSLHTVFLTLCKTQLSTEQKNKEI